MRGAKPSVFIVENETSLATAMDLKLRMSGFETVVVHDGEEAIELLKKRTFSVILLDLLMPKVDGFGVLDFMKKQKLNIPVLVISNAGQVESRKKLEAYDTVKDFLIKSNVSLAQVEERIRREISGA